MGTCTGCFCRIGDVGTLKIDWAHCQRCNADMSHLFNGAQVQYLGDSNDYHVFALRTPVTCTCGHISARALMGCKSDKYSMSLETNTMTEVSK